MTKDHDAIKALAFRPNKFFSLLLQFLLKRFPILKQIYDRVNSTMPDDLEPETLGKVGQLDGVCYNYDEGHAGRFSVPGYAREGASVSFKDVMTKLDGDLIGYIQSNLVFLTPEESDGSDEITVFSPGLNTVHQPLKGETTTPQRLIHYIRVILNVSMCQIHTGTSLDQGDIVIDLSNNLLLRLILAPIFKFAVPEGGNAPYLDGKNLIFSARSIDTIQTGFSTFNLIDTPLKKSFRYLLNSTVQPGTAKPICIVVYSRASVELYAALKQHETDSKKVFKESAEQTFNRLRKYVTILTVGSAARGYVDGPKYVHLASWEDSLTMSMGVSGKNAQDGGKDALMLNFNTCLNPNTGDNHNFGVLTAQYLSLLMFTNDVTSLRALWDKHHADGLKPIDNLKQTLPALISLTKGLDWLWNRDEALKDVPVEEVFPSDDDAEKILYVSMGSDFIDRLKTVQSELPLL